MRSLFGSDIRRRCGAGPLLVGRDKVKDCLAKGRQTREAGRLAGWAVESHHHKLRYASTRGGSDPTTSTPCPTRAAGRLLQQHNYITIGDTSQTPP